MATSLHLEAANLPEDAIEVARIADAWGVKGWFKVVPHSADPEALFSAKRWFLQPSERGAKAFSGTVLLNIRQAKDTRTLWLPGPKVWMTAMPQKHCGVLACLCRAPAFHRPVRTSTTGWT